jgi:hypothetical protein
MEANIISKDSNSITIEIKISVSKSMLKTEEDIQKALNMAGQKATAHALSCFDTNGEPIVIGESKYTSKGKVSKKYQTPYGEIELERHVYQGSSGGSTFCPLDNSARIIVGSTPKFSKQVSSKYSEGGSKRVQVDLEENHGRYISRSFIQDISEAVGKGLLEKQESWNYTIPVEPDSVSSIGISLDGTCMLMVGEGYRQAMVGTISLYNKDGERLYTHYTSVAPEYGKETFIASFEREIQRVKSSYSNAVRIGIADGARDNWQFLEKHTSYQILDFYHASEYITLVSESVFRFKDERVAWAGKMAHKLKHEQNGAKEILEEMKDYRKKRLSEKKKQDLERAVTYFNNHLHQMNYPLYTSKNYPIGSGVVEAACKVIIKQRLCNSGMKWKTEGANTVLCLRCFNYTDTKWAQTWDKINKYGLR